MKETMGDRIKKLINHKGITQKELADAANITEAAISHYLNNSRCPRPKTLAKIAYVLNVSVDYLIEVKNKNSDNEIKQIKLLAARNAPAMTAEERFEIIQILSRASDRL